MASVVFAQEPVTHALLTEALPLLSEHWGEVSHYSDIPLNVDVDGYLAVAQSIRCYTVRGPATEWRLRSREGGQWCLAANELVGYALFFVRANLHYKQSTQAVQDVVYLHPSVRGGTGARFLAYCDEQLAADGVQVVYHHAKLAHPQLAAALSHLGYEPVETIYGKRLDCGISSVRFGNAGGFNARAYPAQHGGHTPEGTAAARDQHASEPAGGAAVQSTPRRRWSDVDETNDLARTSRGTDLIDFTDLLHASADAWAGEDGG